MTDENIMNMPIKRFWVLNGNIDRIASEESLRSLNVAICAQSSEGVRELSQQLVQNMGQVVIKEVERDEQSITDFKQAFNL